MGVERLDGSSGDDTAMMTADQFVSFDFIDLGGGADALKIVVQGAAGLPGLYCPRPWRVTTRWMSRACWPGGPPLRGKDAGSATLGIGGLIFQLVGDFSAGDFMTVARGTGADAHTIVTFENFLPACRKA